MHRSCLALETLAAPGHTEDVTITVLFASIVFPTLFVIGAVGAWRKHQRERAASAAEWRDDSLEEWRRERDARAAAERERRFREAQAALHTGRESQEERETSHQQRIGG